MKSISHNSNARDKLLHIETEYAIINIRVGLTDINGNPVESIEIIPDNYAGRKVEFDGTINNRVIRVKNEVE